MSSDDPQLIDVTSVRVLARYVVEMSFDDGSTKVLDLEDRLTGPDFEWLLNDYDSFCAVTVCGDSGTIQFPNGAEFSAEGLWRAAKPALPA